MTPNFALDLSENGIRLLHRAPSGKGWVKLGEVPLDSDDLGADLAALKDLAAQTAKGPFSTKLVLPPSQLLYASVEIGKDREADIARALEDRTPYEADQLVYDVCGEPPYLQLVAVARETLEEAEGFLGPYGFNPVGFTAVPGPGLFDAEPNLGGMPSGDLKFVPDAKAIVEISAEEAEGDPEPEKIDAEPDTPAEPAPAEDTADETPDAKADLKTEPELAAKKETRAKLKPVTPPKSEEPAAFASRRTRTSSGDDVKTAGEAVARREPRIALPTKPKPEFEAATPEVAEAPKVEPIIKTGTAAKIKPTPPIVPPRAPAVGTNHGRGKTMPPAKLAAALQKRAPTGEPEDALASLAAKQSRGRPRYLGLILTAILIGVLLIFAWLSSYVLPDESFARLFGAEQETEVTAFEPAPILVPEPVEPEFDVASLPDEPLEPPVFSVPSPEELAEAEVPEPEITQPEPVGLVEAEELYSEGGAWAISPALAVPSISSSLRDLYDVSLDPKLAFEDPPALASFDPQAGSSLDLPAPPPPASILFAMDERGLVRPSPEGTLNQDGILVFQGPPPVAAVPRPDGQAPAPTLESAEIIEATPETEVVLEIGELPEVDIAEDPLAEFRPRARPADLVQRYERATLGGRTLNELGGLRPAQRPTDLATAAIAAQERAEEARKAAEAEAVARALAEAAESTAQAQAEAEAAQAELDQPTAQAVAVARRPLARPNDLARRVARAAPTATASTASVDRATGPAVVRSSRARPTGPVSASVARAATDNNAISLGRVALVGVFGTPSNRRALVRMPNGRFKKVAVGDRIDGGRVAAIGDGQLRYTKSGRTVTLDMPRG